MNSGMFSGEKMGDPRVLATYRRRLNLEIWIEPELISYMNEYLWMSLNES